MKFWLGVKFINTQEKAPTTQKNIMNAVTVAADAIVFDLLK